MPNRTPTPPTDPSVTEDPTKVVALLPPEVRREAVHALELAVQAAEATIGAVAALDRLQRVEDELGPHGLPFGVADEVSQAWSRALGIEALYNVLLGAADHVCSQTGCLPNRDRPSIVLLRAEADHALTRLRESASAAADDEPWDSTALWCALQRLEQRLDAIGTEVRTRRIVVEDETGFDRIELSTTPSAGAVSVRTRRGHAGFGRWEATLYADEDSTVPNAGVAVNTSEQCAVDLHAHGTHGLVDGVWSETVAYGHVARIDLSGPEASPDGPEPGTWVHIAAYDDEAEVTLSSGTALAEEKRQGHIGLHVQHRAAGDDLTTATISVESETLGNTPSQQVEA